MSERTNGNRTNTAVTLREGVARLGDRLARMTLLEALHVFGLIIRAALRRAKR